MMKLCTIALLVTASLATGAPYDFRYSLRNAGNTAYQDKILASPGASRVLQWNDSTKLFEWATLAGGGDLLAANNLSDLADKPTALINLGGTTVGKAVFKLTNPSAITWVRVNADNTVTARSASQTIGDLDSDLTTWAGITPGANVGTFLATPSSANLYAVLTTKTGSGGTAVFSTGPTFETSATFGATGGTTGSILFKGTTSGTVTLSVAAAAGTYTLKLPTTDGNPNEVLQTDGSGNTSWIDISSLTFDESADYTLTGTWDFTGATVSFDTFSVTNLNATNLTFEGATADAFETTLTVVDPTADRTATLPDADTKVLISAYHHTIAGPTQARTITTPDANFTVARTDAANTFTGASTASAWVLTSPTITTSIVPTANDGAALGSTSNQFSDLFLASGAVLNFANGNAVLTHTSGIVTMGTGELRITTAGTNTASVITQGSTNTLANKTIDLGSNTVTATSAQVATAVSDETGTGSLVLGTKPVVDLGVSMGSDDTFTGLTRTGLNNSGGVTQWETVYLNSSSQWVLADANGSGTYPCRGLATATASTGNATTVITRGTVRNDAWNWTVGGTIYLSTTAGGLTQTAPSTTGDKIQVIGYALDADTMAVEISPDYGTAP